MKTRKSFFISILAISIAAVSCTQNGSSEASKTSEDKASSVELSSISIDVSKSQVMWAGTMLGVYTHEGILNLTEAELYFTNGKISSGNFTVDMNSIYPTDENYKPEEGTTPEKLVGHLKSADFFDVENFPTASFRISGSEGNTVTGMLTLRGITKEEKVENVAISKADETVKITGTMTVDRKKYGVAWDSSAKEMVLSDDVELEIMLTGK